MSSEPASFGTLADQILTAHSTGRAIPESLYREVFPDLILGHDATLALLIDSARDLGMELAAPEKCLFAVDHFAPPSSAERAGILRKFLDFATENPLVTLRSLEGICHQLLVEDSRCLPGKLVVGADSHTTTAGALGCFATGFGSTDILAVLMTGRTWMRIPETIRVIFEGDTPAWIGGRDLALYLLGILGEGGAAYMALEYEDRTGNGISIDSRLTISNLAVESGAKAGIFIPDRITFEYISGRDHKILQSPVPIPADDAVYAREITIDTTGLEPLVARPGSPADVVPVGELDEPVVDQVFIGSCTGGRLEDLEAAARVLEGRHIPRFVRLVITPASAGVFREALRLGYLETLIRAGGVITNPSCGACGGIDKGLLADSEVCVSTSSRNHPGRMGAPGASIYLASALTAAASAFAGRIIDPREMDTSTSFPANGKG